MIHTSGVKSLPPGGHGAPRFGARKPGVSFTPARPMPADVPAPRSTSSSRARLSVVLLSYFVGVVAVVTLAPFDFALPSTIRVVGTDSWLDLAGAFFLLIPLGFLYPLTRRGDTRPSWQVLLPGGAFAATLAVARAFELGGSISILDIGSGAGGAFVGSFLLAAANRRIRRSPRLAGRLSLEIPLMGLIYLLVPLLIVASFSAADDSLRIVALLPLGLLGARLLSAVQEHYYGPAGVFRSRSMAVVAGGWTVIAGFPVLLRTPLVGSGLVLLVVLATLYESSAPTVLGSERRFEADVLRSAVPYVAAYWIAVLLLPLTSGLDPWHFSIGLTGADGDRGRQVIRLLESIAALTVLGYMLAEARGRRELPFWIAARRVLMECACLVAAAQASRGFAPDSGASGVESMLMLCGALLGAAIYHKQRERVQWILIHGAPKPPITPHTGFPSR